MAYKASPKPQLYGVRDTATVLGLGMTKTWEMVNSGELETVRIGRRRLIKVSSIDALLDRTAVFSPNGGAA